MASGGGPSSQLDALAPGAGDPALRASVLALIDRDRLPAQPPCSEAMLDQALAGRSPVDDAFWREIVELHNVTRVHDGRVVGVVAFGRKQDGDGTIPWLHAAEDPRQVGTLLDIADQHLGDVAGIDAFQHATALGVGIEGLPVERRPATHAALIERGYHGCDLWLAMRGPIEPTEAITADVKPIDDDHGTGASFELRVRAGSAPAAEAHVGIGAPGLGVIWWIEVEPAFRGRGLGRSLLRQARSVLAAHGVTELILYVDHDSPTDPDRDRRPAIALYRSEGFTVIDHLWSYQHERRSSIR